MKADDDTTARISALETQVSTLLKQLRAAGNRTRDDHLFDNMYKEAIIHQEIFKMLDTDVVQKQGAAAGWDETSYVSNVWNLRNIMNLGSNVNGNGNGLKVNIPKGYDVLWLRVLNDRWATFRVCPFVNGVADYSTASIEKYAGGFRNLNAISPDGAAPDSQWNFHSWMPIPIRGQDTAAYMIQSDYAGDDWISGIAFGKNIWNHATNSGVAYYWALNGGQATGWANGFENWNNDVLSFFQAGSNDAVHVPVVYSGKDKMIYIVQHNDNWVGTMHTGVYVNGKPVDRFRTSWSNPFQRHQDGKFYCRYMGTRIPAKMISPNDRFLELRVDMTTSNNHLYFREIGTHDFNLK